MTIKYFYILCVLLITNCNNSGSEKNVSTRKTDFNMDSLEKIAVLTTKNIVNHGALISRVYHCSDSSWQFFDTLSTNENKNIMVVGFGQMLKLDSSLTKVLNIPISHFAYRNDSLDDWKVEPYKESNE